MKRFVRVGVIAAVVAGIGFAAGPRLRVEPRWVEPTLPEDIASWLATEEAQVAQLRRTAEKEVLWVDRDVRGRTPLSLVYLHGFSADRHEVEPLVEEVGRELGANVFFTRLTGHGRDGAAMAEATTEDWFDDVAEAIAVGARIGERVVVVGTSTGGTLAVWAAARPETEGRIAAMVLMSPNFQPRNRSTRIALLPWGRQIAELAVGEERCWTAANDQQEAHWTTCYPTRAILPMMGLVEATADSDLTAIAMPVLVLQSPDDTVVDPVATEEAVARMTSAEVTLRTDIHPDDASHHLLAGEIMSPSTTDDVRAIIVDFLVESGLADRRVP